jgi:hypothetical protein
MIRLGISRDELTMANELAVAFAFSFNKPEVSPGPIGPVTTPTQITVNGNTYIMASMEAPITTPGAVPLGGVTNPHWSFFQNNDPTNYIQIQNGVSGAVLCRLGPGEFSPIPLDPTCTPYVIANTAPVAISYLILPE